MILSEDLSSAASQSDLVVSLGNTVDSTIALFRPLVVVGGSAVPANIREARPQPVDAEGNMLYGVFFSNLTANAACHVSISPLPPNGYGLDGIYASPEGEVCLWLPEGEYAVNIDGTTWTAAVTNGNVTTLCAAFASGAVPVSKIAVSASDVGLTIPTSARSGFRIYASPTLPFPAVPNEIDLSQCSLTDNGDGTTTISIPLVGPPPQMFFKVVGPRE